MVEIKLRVRELREKCNITQEELADRLGVEPPAVSKWERGLAFPRMDKLVAMADIFDCTVDCILGREPFRDSQNTA